MSPTESLRAAEESTLEAARKLDDNEILIALTADMDEEGRFGEHRLEVTRTHVRTFTPSGAVAFQIPIREIKAARNEPLVGGGRLEITTRAGEIIPIVTYTMTHAAKFSEAARGIEQLAKAEELLVNLKVEQLRCPKCSRLLPERDGVCPSCVNRGRTFMRIMAYLQPYKKQGAVLCGLAIAQAVINLIPPKIQGSIIDGILTTHRNLPSLYWWIGLWLGVVVASTFVQIATGRYVSFLAANIAADMRASVYRAIEFLQVSYFDKKQVGAIASRVTQDTDRVWGFLVDGLPYLVSNGLLLVGIVVFLFLTSAKLAMFVLAPMPVVILISAIWWKPISKLFYRVGQKWARFHMHLNESLSGIRVVKAFAQEDSENEKFLRRNRELRDSGVNADTKWYTVFGAMTFFTALGALINWTVGGYMVYNNEMTLGQFVQVNQLLTLVYMPLQWFGQLNNWFSRAMAGAERIFEVMDTVKEPYAFSTTDDGRQTTENEKRKTKNGSDCSQNPTPNARGLITQRPDDPATRIKGEVHFNNVRFGYDKSNPVLKGIDFVAKPGEMIGLVGKSGAGKSTTINLICRFYEPDAGAVRIDGMDYRDIPLQELRRQIGLVLQEPFLFNGTIAENISYARPGAKFEDIIQAAKDANAHSFILGKPDGYDTQVGERGAKLSGGERQRISIARALLHNPRILILDEATSSVDVETEAQIQEALNRLMEGRTTFAIAHRLSTLRNADRLIVLDNGEIVEMGTHTELMEKQGEFYKLVETQSHATQIIALAG